MKDVGETQRNPAGNVQCCHRQKGQPHSGSALASGDQKRHVVLQKVDHLSLRFTRPADPSPEKQCEPRVSAFGVATFISAKNATLSVESHTHIPRPRKCTVKGPYTDANNDRYWSSRVRIRHVQLSGEVSASSRELTEAITSLSDSSVDLTVIALTSGTSAFYGVAGQAC